MLYWGYSNHWRRRGSRFRRRLTLLLGALLAMLAVLVVLGLKKGWFEPGRSSAPTAASSPKAVPPAGERRKSEPGKTTSPADPPYIRAIFPPTH